MKTNFVKEEKDLGNAVENLKTVQPEWRYVETPLVAEVEAGDIRLRPHWKGAMDASAIREVVHKAAAAPSLYTFLQKIYLDYEDDCGCECNTENCCAVVGERCAKCHAGIALALVDGPQTKEGVKK